MSRRLLLGLVAGALLAVLVALALFLSPGDNPLVEERVEGDVEGAVAAMDPAQMPAIAKGLLATDRPWRAARVMRSYMEQADSATVEHRVLAARAEAGWGDWPEVRTLLEEVSGLEQHENGIGLYLLGRARAEAGDARGAVQAFRSFLALSPPAAEMEEERAGARLHLGLALTRAGDREAGRRELQAASQGLGGAAVWLDILVADALAQAGDTAAVRAAVSEFDSGYLGLRAWRARIEAVRQVKDIARVRALARQAQNWAKSNDSRAEFMLAEGRAAIESGDVAAGRAALRRTVGLGAASPHAQAAADLLRAGPMNADDHLASARVYTGLGLHEPSVDGYRRWLDSGAGTAADKAKVRMEYANALFYAERYGEVAAALRPIAGQTEARLLQARAESNSGNADEAVEIYLAVNQEQPKTDTGVQALLLAAATRHDAGEVDAARELFQRFVSQYPGTDQAGLARMRLAGIAFLEKDFAGAERIWEEYRTRSPRGPLALQATYWSGVAQAEQGDSAAAKALFRSVRQRQPDSYYALLASQRLREPFWPIPMGAAPPRSRADSVRVAGWLRGVDVLREAGFPEEASAEVDRVAANAGGNTGTLYALAEALAARGYSQRAIRIGLRLQGSKPPNRRVLGILYPFPFRTLITEEAEERGLDPFVTAALIRQESMFEARNTSHVGARGLMQIMPATGETLGEAVGIERWDPEVLYHPEINVHLGTRYVAENSEKFDGSLPSVFSAYNAGPHRVDVWKEFPEYGQDELFTERIPFRETREYVKILTRNRALYQGLYGEGR